RPAADGRDPGRHGPVRPHRLAAAQAGRAAGVDPARPARRPRPAGDLRRGRRRLRGRPRGRDPPLRRRVVRRVRPHAAGDGARPSPPGSAAKPEAAHRGGGAVELRADPRPGRRPRDAHRAGPADPGDGDAVQAPGLGPGAGGAPPGQDHVPADGVHPAGAVRGDPRSGGDQHRPQPLMQSPGGGRFPALILTLRWAAVTLGAVLSLVDLRHSMAAMAATSLLCFYAGARILRPLPRPEELEVAPGDIALELGVALVAVVLSGGFGSPYVFVILVPVLLAGFTQGYTAGFVAAGAAGLPLVVVGATLPSARVPTETASQVLLVFAATGALAGYARRLFVEAAAEQASFEDRVSTLTEANALLSQLTRLALTLPSSLDLGDTVSAAMGHLRQLFDFTGAAVLVLDAATGTWRAEGVAGRPVPAPMTTGHLPPPLLQLALRNGSGPPARGAITEALDAAGGGQGGLWPGSRSGIYAPLVARDHLVAVVALERDGGAPFDGRDVEVLSGLAEPLALAIDNGLWFDRLRRLGAEGERDRLARDLHDRFAQGLAYVNLELDRLSRHPAPGPQLVELRQEVGGLLGEVRETLRQLRSRVGPSAGLADLLAAELPR